MVDGGGWWWWEGVAEWGMEDWGIGDGLGHDFYLCELRYG